MAQQLLPIIMEQLCEELAKVTDMPTIFANTRSIKTIQLCLALLQHAYHQQSVSGTLWQSLMVESNPDIRRFVDGFDLHGEDQWGCPLALSLKAEVSPPLFWALTRQSRPVQQAVDRWANQWFHGLLLPGR